MPRRGFITASTFPDLMTHGKGKEAFGKTAMRHIEQLALDLLDADRDDEITAESLEWGKEQEDNARFVYAGLTLADVRESGFGVSKELPYVGGTMDGLVGPDGGIEIKCPRSSQKHLFHFDEHCAEYEYQVQGYLWIFGLKWIDFISYDPRCPAQYQLMIKRVEPNAGIIGALQERCKLAHAKAIELVNSVRSANAQ